MRLMRYSLLCACCFAAGHLYAQQSPQAQRLAQTALIVDTHIDAPDMGMEAWRDLGTSTEREFDYSKARAGGLDVAFMSIYTSPKQDTDDTAWQAANQQIDFIEALIARHPDKFAALRSPQQVAENKLEGLVLLPLGMENGAPLRDDIKNVQFFFDRGVRYITLAHSAANRIADSSYGVARKWNGLSPFGKEVVAEMNRVGMMIDVSHLSDQATAQAIALSRAPVLATHSGFRYFTPGFERNISDELAKAIATKGGVVQITFGVGFINAQAASDMQAKFRAREALRQRNANAQVAGKPLEDESAFSKQWDTEHPVPATPISAVLDQIDYAVKTIGIDHVGIGSDFDGVSGELPEGLRNVADYPNLIAGLQKRGYADTDIEKILGKNLLRMWTAVEQAADNTQRSPP